MTQAPGLADSWAANLLATGLCVAAWGYFLYQGVADPLGGINTLWPLFGIANQMLAAVALVLATVVLFKMKKGPYAWVSAVPAVWLLACTSTAGYLKIFSPDPKVGFVAHAHRFEEAIAQGKVLAPSPSLDAMQRVVFNDYLDAGLCALFMAVVISIVVYGLRSIMAAVRSPCITAHEAQFVAMAKTS